jgi:hypothetical protein
MIEAPAHFAGKARIADHLRPVEQQIVIVENVLPLLRLDIDGEQLLQFGSPGGASRNDVASTSSIGNSALTHRE